MGRSGALQKKEKDMTASGNECWMSVQKMLALWPLNWRGPIPVYVHPPAPPTAHTHTPPAQTALPKTHGDRQMDRSGWRRWFGVMLLNSSQHNSGWLIWTAIHRTHFCLKTREEEKDVLNPLLKCKHFSNTGRFKWNTLSCGLPSVLRI